MKQIRIIKGTRASGKRLTAGKVVKVGADINDKDARFLVATGQAEEVGPGAKDEPEDKPKAPAK